MPRRPARPQAASDVGVSLRIVHQSCPTCQVRANATEKGRRRVPTLASGAPPRERKDAVWAGFEVAGGLWVLISRSARFSSVKHARTHKHTHAHTRTYTHTHTQTHTHRCAGGSYPSHPTSSVHLDIDLLCAPNGIAESGIFRKGSARPERCAHATLGTGQSLPAYSRRLVSLQAVDRFVLAHGTCLRSAGCSASDLELAA